MFVWVAVCLLAGAPVWAEGTTLTIAAGPHARQHTPVTADVPLAAVGKNLRVQLRPAQGRGEAIEAQAEVLPQAGTARLWFVLPSLPAGQTGRYEVVSPAAGAPVPSFGFREEQGQHEDIVVGTRPVLRYMCGFDENKLHDTYKVYHHVFDSEGKGPITKGPGGKYTHHRGLFIGWSRTGFDGQRVDTWHMGNCSQRHQQILSRFAGPVLGRHTALIHWVDKQASAFLAEERTLTAFKQPERCALIDFETTLKAVKGPVELNGDPEHAGCQFRPSNEVAENKSAKYLFRDDAKKPPKVRDQDWVVCSFRLGDKQFHVAQMVHPTNPERPIWSAYRDYGRFGSYFKHTLKPDAPLKLRYRFWITEGEQPPSREQVEQRYGDFVSPPKVSVQ